MRPRLSASILLLLCSLTAQAAHLPALGPTYPIAERNLLDHIMQRLHAMQASGELARLQEQARERAIGRIESPPAVPGLRRSQGPRTYYFDPTFTLTQNVVDAQGKVLFAAGTRKNPLEVVALSKHLLFFDGRDPLQLTRAQELIEHYRGRVKPILVGGSYMRLMRHWQVPVFYDQDGVLVRRLGIEAVPALVSQEGMRLRIDEVELRP